MFNRLKYYLWRSYRRDLIDACLREHSSIFRGIVLDIGGRDRGKFQKPKAFVEKWIFADINSDHHPDIVLDVAHMDSVATESIDCVCACELFEHVEEIERGLDECVRVLKKNGALILSVPFLYAIHADPHDYQRWTETKWKRELKSRGLEINTFVVMGRYFTVLADQIKTFIKVLPRLVRIGSYAIFPILDLMVLLDRTNFVLSKPLLRNAHGGYFIIATKFDSKSDLI